MGAYTTTAWRTTRGTYLSTHPNCVDCGQPATQPDHTPPRTLLLTLGIHNPDHERWLRPRCTRCHSIKTRVVDEPILKRWHQGEDTNALANEATRLERTHTRTRRR